MLCHVSTLYSKPLFSCPWLFIFYLPDTFLMEIWLLKCTFFHCAPRVSCICFDHCTSCQVMDSENHDLGWSVTRSPCYSCPICCPWFYYLLIHPHSLALVQASPAGSEHEILWGFCPLLISAWSWGFLYLRFGAWFSFIQQGMLDSFQKFLVPSYLLTSMTVHFQCPQFCLRIDHWNKPHHHSASQIGKREHFPCLVFHVILDATSGRTLMCPCISIPELRACTEVTCFWGGRSSD